MAVSGQFSWPPVGRNYWSLTSFDPDTRAYMEQRTEEGKTGRVIRRCLKRIIVSMTLEN